MKTSESIINIIPAFLTAQKEIISVIKDQTNPYFNSKYADISAVIEACKEPLNKQGIAILQPIDGMNVETILIHTSGEWFSSLTPVVCKEANNPQALGSAITYAKRYGLQSMVLLPAEDDDGNKAATDNKKEPVKKEEQTPDPTDEWDQGNELVKDHICPIHNVKMIHRGNGSYDHRAILNENLEYDPKGVWHMCFGEKWIRNVRST